MWVHILKKDLQKRKGVNIILFIFIMVATLLFASSVHNILIVTGGIDYYMDYAKVADIQVILNGQMEKKKLKNWLNQQSDVEEYTHEKILEVSEKEISINRDHKPSGYDAGGVSLYLGTANAENCIPYDVDGRKIQLEENQCALTGSAMDKNKLEIGDKISFHVGSVKKTFIVAYQSKDIMFGSDMSGMTRFLVSEANYKKMEKQADVNNIKELFYITAKDTNNVYQDLNNQSSRLL